MPDLMVTAFSRLAPSVPAAPPRLVPPRSVWVAMSRGFIGRCPHCGRGRLFHRFLKPVANCASCDEDWTPQRADDFPAYGALFITGHVMAPLLVHLAQSTALTVIAIWAIVLPLALLMSVGLLQPVKGAIIALQWWMGMHGFKGQRAAERDTD